MFHLTLVRRQSDNIKLPGLDPPAYQTSTVALAIPPQFLSRIWQDRKEDITVLSERQKKRWSRSHPSSDDRSLAWVLNVSVRSNLVLRVHIVLWCDTKRYSVKLTFLGTFETKNGPSTSLVVKSPHCCERTPPSRKERENITTWSISNDWLRALEFGNS